MTPTTLSQAIVNHDRHQSCIGNHEESEYNNHKPLWEKLIENEPQPVKR